jgi:hypothetical protein
LDETHWLENAGGQFELVDFSKLTAPWMQRMKPPYHNPPYQNPGGLQHRTARTRQDVLFETGTPVTFRAMRNTAPSVYMGSQFGQDIEPAGTFMLVDDYDAWNDPGAQVGGWVFFVQRFTSPLVIAMVADDDPMAPIYGPTGWKQRLSEAFGGATGVELSEAILASGHDGVVTVGPAPNDVREVVDLTRLPRSVAHRAKKNSDVRQVPLEVKLAIGRLMRILSRPYQPGDDDEYWRCRNIILDASEEAGFDFTDYAPNWVRDRLKGAQGD